MDGKAGMGMQFTYGIRSGRPVAIPGGTATPRAFHMAWQGPHFGIFWNTPVGVDVQRDSGVTRLPIVDVTRWAQLIMTMAALLVLPLAAAALLRKRGENHE